MDGAPVFVYQVLVPALWALLVGAKAINSVHSRMQLSHGALLDGSDGARAYAQALGRRGIACAHSYSPRPLPSE